MGLNLRSEARLAVAPGSPRPAEGRAAVQAAGLSACRPEQRGRLGLGALRTEILLFPPFAFPLLALDSLWSREPEHGAPAQPFGVGPRAGRSRREEPGSPRSRGGPGEEKNVLLNNNAFVRKRVCVKHFLKLPRSFPGVPEAGWQQRAWLPSSPGARGACGRGTGACCPRASSVSPRSCSRWPKERAWLWW